MTGIHKLTSCGRGSGLDKVVQTKKSELELAYCETQQCPQITQTSFAASPKHCTIHAIQGMVPGRSHPLQDDIMKHSSTSSNSSLQNCPRVGPQAQNVTG